MKKRNIFIFLGLAAGFTLILPYAAGAQDTLKFLGDVGTKAGLEQSRTVPEIVGGIVKAFLSLLGIIAVVIIIYGGYMWMTAAGSEEKVSTAKKLLTQAVIGLAITLAAYSITTFIVSNIQKSAGVGTGVGDQKTTPPGRGRGPGFN